VYGLCLLCLRMEASGRLCECDDESLGSVKDREFIISQD
jgi:hypothetical protein